MRTFDLTDTQFKIEINDIHNQAADKYIESRSRELMVMVKYNDEVREWFKSVAFKEGQSLCFAGRDVVLHGEFNVQDSHVRVGKMGKVVTLHLISQGYTLMHGLSAVRKFFIDNVLSDLQAEEVA